MDRIELTPARTTPTHPDWAERVTAWVERFRPATVTSYRRWERTWVAWCADRGLDPWAARRGDVETWLVSLAARDLKPATCALAYDAIKSLYTWLWDDELIDRNPAARIRRPVVHVEAQRRTWLPPLQYAGFLVTARRLGADEYAVAVLGGMMGLRSGEICSLNVTDVQHHGAHYVLTYTGKGGKPATSPVPIPAQRAILALLEQRTDGPLVRSKADTRLNTRSLVRMVRRIAAAAGVDDLTPHGLRRTFASTGLATGVSERDMMIATRHVRRSTLAVYDMHFGALDTHASHRIAGILSGFAG